MEICKGIYFRLYGEETYVVNTVTGQKYLFNEIVFQILSILEASSGVSFDELCEKLSEMYQIEDFPQFVMDISDFMSLLEGEGIVSPEDSSITDGAIADINVAIAEVCNATNQLEHVYIELTHRCNASCVHCYIHNEHTVYGQEMTTAEIYSLLDHLYEIGVMQVTFTGGEPTIREDFLDILNYAVKYFSVNIYSNLLSISSDLLKSLIKMPIYKISTSLYSSVAEEHDAITRVPGSFNRTFQNLLMLSKAGIRTSVKATFFSKNEDALLKLVDLLAALNIETEVSLQLLASCQGDTKRQELRILNEDKYYKLMTQYNHIYDSCNPEPNRRGHYVCGIGKTLNIDPYGNVFPCNVMNYVLGNIRKQTVKDIWDHSEELIRFRTFSLKNLEDRCQNCPDFNYCLYCPGACYREHGDMSHHCEESCLLARAKRRAAENLH